jgi:hypothetical protein
MKIEIRIVDVEAESARYQVEHHISPPFTVCP